LLLPFLQGCGGFSEQVGGTNGAGGAANILVQGQIQFSQGANPSVSKVRRAVSLVPVSGARISIYDAQDLFFENDLLKPEAIVLSSPSGGFFVTEDQFLETALSNPPRVLTVRARFGEFELTSLIPSVSRTAPLAGSLTVNPVSDGAFRLLKEEVVQRSGGVSGSNNLNQATWKTQIQDLAISLANQRTSLQQNIVLDGIDLDSYKPSTNLQNRSAGQDFEAKLVQASQNVESLQALTQQAQQLKLTALLDAPVAQDAVSRATQIRRRKLQLFWALLGAGFAVSNGDASFYIKDTITNLEAGVAPELGDALNLDGLKDHFESALTSEDLKLFPRLPGTKRITIAQMQTLKGTGPSGEEKVVTLAQSLQRRVWISKSSVNALAQLTNSNFASPVQALTDLAQVIEQKRFSVDRVRTELPSGGLAFLGEKLPLIEEFGGVNPGLTELSAFFSGLNLSSSFESFLDQEGVFFGILPQSYRTEYARLVAREQSLTDLNNSYPDPVSKSGVKNLVFRVLSGVRTFNNQRAQERIKRLEALYPSLQTLKDSSSTGMALNTTRRVSELFALISVVPQLAFPVETSRGYYKSVVGSSVGVAPNFENLKVLEFPVEQADNLWRRMISRSNPSLVIATDAGLLNLSQSLTSFTATTIPHLSVAKSLGVSVSVQGQVFITTSPVQAAANFPLQLVETTPGTTSPILILSQTSSDGSFTLSNPKVLGDRFYELRFRLKNTPGAASLVTTVAMPIYVSGFGDPLKLPSFYLESDYRLRATSYTGLTTQIQPENFPPTLTLKDPPNITSGILPIELTLVDVESDPVLVDFDFTSGFALTVLTANPRISISSQAFGAGSPTTFSTNGLLGPFASSPSGVPLTLYWHTGNEPNGFLSQGFVPNIRISARAREFSNPVIAGAIKNSSFFNLDNNPPQLQFFAPLRDLRDPNSVDFAESSQRAVTVTGTAVDNSQIVTISVINVSLGESNPTSYFAVNTGDNFNTWRIEGVPLKLGVVNNFHFFSRDIHGNQNTQPVTASIRSLDSVPPDVVLSDIRIFSTRNSPVLTSLSTVPFSVATSVLPAGGGVTSSYFINLDTTSRALQLSVLTTRHVILRGRVRDVNGVSLVRVAGQDVFPVTTDLVNYTWSREMNLNEVQNLDVKITAIDGKNNDSGTTVLEDAQKTLSAVSLKIQTIDYSPPSVAITNLTAGRSPQTVTTNQITISGAATDFSRITSFELCSSLCRSVVTSDNYLSWSVSLPLSERVTNIIQGFVRDEYNFSEQFNASSPFVTLNLNDISPPTMTLTSVGLLNLTTPIFVDSSFTTPPHTNPAPLYVSMSSCTGTTLCTEIVRGFLRDESGINLVGGDDYDFVGFKMRLADRANFLVNDPATTIEDLWGKPAPSRFLSNGRNKFLITTQAVSSFVNNEGVQTHVPFLATALIQDDGYWPLEIEVRDNSSDQFGDFSQPLIRKREVMYFVKDKTSPDITNLSVADGASLSGSRLNLSGFVRDELSTIAQVQANAITTSTFTNVSITSPWNRFLSLPSQSAVSFQLSVTLPAGPNQTLTVQARDSFGNISTKTVSVNVLPLYTTQVAYQFQYLNPFAIGFGGDSLDRVLVADEGRAQVREFTVNGILQNTIFGNQKTGTGFYDKLNTLKAFDYFYNRADKSQRMLVGGDFDDNQPNTPTRPSDEVLRLVRETASQAALGNFLTENEGIPGSGYQVFRGNNASLNSQTSQFSTSYLLRYAPKLESVAYVYRSTGTNGQNQLTRYVNGFDAPVTQLLASNGGITRVTGILGPGVEPFVISSQVKSMVVTQVHILGSTFGTQGVDKSEEWIFLADYQKQRIARFHNVNLPNGNGGGIRPMDPISLTTGGVNLRPLAMDVNPAGDTAYLANELDLKVYKLRITSTTPQLLTSFGGIGITNGRFESIRHIRGLQPVGESDFTELYVVDPISRRVSVYSTAGVFLRYFGQNPFDLGGIRNPALISEKDGQWFLLDEDLDAIDIYTSLNTPSTRLTTASLGITDFQTSLEFLFAPLAGFENRTNLDSAAYQTASTELFKTETQEMFYLQGPNNLVHVVDSKSFSFTAAISGAVRAVNIVVNDTPPNAESITRGRVTFTNLVDMTLAIDGSNLRLLTLENPAGAGRVQEITFVNQSKPATFDILPSSTQMQQTSPVGICEVTTGILVVGSSPANQVDLARYPTGLKQFFNNFAFEQLNLRGFLGESISLNNPGRIDCAGDTVAIAQNNDVLVFKMPAQPSQGLSLIQRISSTDPSLVSTDPLRALSGPLDVKILGSKLYVLEKNRKRVLEYRLQ